MTIRPTVVAYRPAYLKLTLATGNVQQRQLRKLVRDGALCTPLRHGQDTENECEAHRANQKMHSSH